MATDMKMAFLTSGPIEWQKCIDFAKTLQGGLHTQLFDLLNDRKIVFDVEIKVKQSGRNLLAYEATRDPVDGGESVSCMNSDYAFKITRRNIQSPWMLTSLETVNAENSSTFLDGPCYRSALPFLHIGRQFLPDLIKDPGFVLKTTQIVHAEIGELCRIEFDYEPKTIENYPERGG
jgi:hypothetical protein